MNIKQNIVTKNPCYTCGRTITVKGLMIHSVGCPQPRASVFANNWNNANANVCVHAVLQADGTVLQLLPWNRRGWHCGSGNNGSGNNTHIGVEMTEPDTIQYTGGSSFKDLNPAATKDFVAKTYRTAVELFAYLCKQYSLDPEKDGVIISHSEGHKRGIASNHGDVEHIWNKYGLTMAQFRRDIKKAMGGNATAGGTAQTAGTTAGNAPKSVSKGDTVTFTGGPVYKSSTAAQATVNKGVTSKCEVTAVNLKGTHPYHCISQDGKGVYGWVNAESVKEVSTTAGNAPKSVSKGDTVTFTGGPVYKSSTAAQAATTKSVSSRCEVTAINEKGTHPYHCISQDGKGVYGWVDKASVKK